MGRQCQKERNVPSKRSESDVSAAVAAATAAREELVRVRLLAELSTLREKHEKLSAMLREPEEDFGGSFGQWMGDSNDWRADGAVLGQDDRDAIEALFNESNDSFTREFNEGCGCVDRDGILEKMLSSAEK